MKLRFLVPYIKSLHRILGTMNLRVLKERKAFFSENDAIDFFKIPIFIISYNRLSYLREMIEKLEKFGYKKLIIIDNCSTYPPLIEYYESLKYEVIRLKDNLGHMAFWKSPQFDEYRKQLYVVTDPDVIPIDECPTDFVRHFYTYLKRYPRIGKAGFSLKIDDIPKDSSMYDKIIAWEQPYNLLKIPFQNAYSADIDTTFALYLPDHLHLSRKFLTSIRTGHPYQARHLPWYKQANVVDEEELFYSSHRTNGFWDVSTGDRTGEGTKKNMEY